MPPPAISPIHDAAGQLSAPQDELLRHAMHDDIARIHAEIQQRLAAVGIADEYRGQFGIRCEAQARVHAVVGRGDRAASAGSPQYQ